MKITEFNEALKSAGLNKKEFAEKTNMTYQSVTNWADDTRPIPGWVKSWLENYRKSKSFDTIAGLVKKELWCE